jgi:integrase
VRDERGQPLTYDTLFNRFEKARNAAGVHFQLRDLRAKAGTDLEDLALAQKLLGHSSRAMTEHYIKRRLGDVVRPLLRTPLGIADKKNGAK